MQHRQQQPRYEKRRHHGDLHGVRQLFEETAGESAHQSEGKWMTMVDNDEAIIAGNRLLMACFTAKNFDGQDFPRVLGKSVR